MLQIFQWTGGISFLKKLSQSLQEEENIVFGNQGS